MNVYVKLLPQIVQNLTQIDDVLDYLQSGGHITTRNCEIIKSQNTESNSIRKMLDILQKRNCSPQTFVDILCKTSNEHLMKIFQTETRSEVVQEKPMPRAKNKRKVFILVGMNEEEILRDSFSGSNPDWDVSILLGSVSKLKEEIASIPENTYRYFDIIVVCDEDYNNITNESLKTILPRIENELLPKFPPGIITFLIIVDENDDDGYIYHPDKKPGSFGDAKFAKTVFRILKIKFLHQFIKAFLKSEETFNIYIDKKFLSEKSLVDKKPVEETKDKRKIFILKRNEQNDILHEYFEGSNPDRDVSTLLGSVSKLKEEIASIPQNEFSFFDVIVLCDDQLNDITYESLKAMISRIEKELLPKFPPGIITFLIIVVANDDNGYVFHSDTKPASFGDAQISKPVFRIVKKNIFEKYMEAFFTHEKMFNIFIDEKFHLESHLMKRKPWEEKTDKRKIFILEGMIQNDILHEHFEESNPNQDTSFNLNTLNSLMEQIALIPENNFRYFDIIAEFDEDYNDIISESLKTMLSKYPSSIITFLIIVDVLDDNKTQSQHEINNDTQAVIALLKREFFPEFWKSFIESKEMFNVFIRKADTRKELRLQTYGREEFL